MQNIIDLLEGKYLVGMGRSIDVTWLIFSVEENNKEGDCALHVQSPWRIFTDERLVIGSGDIYEALPEVEYDEWDIVGNSQFDLIVNNDICKVLPLKNDSVKLNQYGDLKIYFSNDFYLEIFANSCSAIEYWRLIDYIKDEHYVFFETE